MFAEEELYELRGQLLLPDRRPLQFAVVSLEGVTKPFSRQKRAGLDGVFKFKDLPPTMYRLHILSNSGEMERSIEIGPTFADKKRRIRITIEFDPELPREGRTTISVTQLTIPESAKKEYIKALEYLEGSATDNAVEHLKKAVEIAPHYSAALNRLGTISFMSTEYPQAEIYFREALKHSPDDYSPVVNLGAALLLQRKLDEALEMNGRSVKMNSRDPLARSQLGQTYLALGDIQKAIEQLIIAKSLDPSHFSYPQLILAEIYRMQGDSSRQISELEDFLDRHPDSEISGQIREVLKAAKEEASQQTGSPSSLK
jgi:tetratricopeptide (TPR) repeat protein